MVGPGRQERSWIRGARAGSVSDLEALFREHWPRAHRAAYLVVQDAAAAEDIAQEAFLSALRNLDRFDRRRPFGPWLHRIVVNRAIDWARARALRRELSEVPGSEDFDTGDLGTFSEGVAAGLASLPPDQRAVIVLRYLLEYTPGRDRGPARAAARDGQLAPAPRPRPARGDRRQGAAVSDDVRRSLQRIQAPDEIDAQRRAWALVRASFDAREPVSWQRRNRRPLLVVALALLVLLAAFVSPPGRALVGSVRDAVTPNEHTSKPKPALTALPAGGSLLVNSSKGPWIVHPDGSMRLLGPWWEGAWSPNAEHVAVTRAHRLAALAPDGTIKWSLARAKLLHGARWSLEPRASAAGSRI